MNSNTMAAITVSNYTKQYDKTLAVDKLSLDVEAGQVLGLLGPNGAGKTTTLRALAGIIVPTSGAITIAGHDIVRDPVAAKQQLAYVPDDPRLFDTLTVWEHLAFTASAYRVPDYQAIAEPLLKEFELEDKRHAPASTLSRGMRQKVAICCAYLHAPQALFFDEPHTGLDPHGIRAISESIRRRAAQGAAVIVSSHLLALVEGLCTHLLILHKGRSVYRGPIAEAYGAFGELATSASLEEIFFRATEVPSTTSTDAHQELSQE
jgi:ABC-2 type transport system ATP-binding protein